ncbi:hypothetical protein V6N13_139994 [Hibiscus sabdariffa]
MLERGVEPDNFTYPALFKACAWLKAKEEGMKIHGHAFKLGFENDLYVQNSLINMYGKCGQIEHACAVFEQMDENSVIIAANASLGMCKGTGEEAHWSYTVMISGLAMHGHGEEDLRIYSLMLEEGLDPDVVVYLSVLSTCGHAGLVDEGVGCFDRMKSEHKQQINIMVVW